MSDGEERSSAHDRLLRTATALAATARRFATSVPGDHDHAFADVLRTWREEVAALRLHAARLDDRLRGYAPYGPHRDAAPATAGAPTFAGWRERIERFLDGNHLPGAYRRIELVLEPAEEAVTADIATDLAQMLSWCDRAVPALEAGIRERDPGRSADALFYRVLAPWRREARGAALAVSAWLDAVIDDAEDW